jgi:hypothetical protein
MAFRARGTRRGPDQGLDVFLNNIWLATAFALTLLAAIFGLLFFLAWLEPRHGRRDLAPKHQSAASAARPPV